MLVYNTTYTVPNEDARNFVIWIHQSVLPKVKEEGTLNNPHLLRILSHRDQETECFSLQFDVADTASLHRWYTNQGTEIEKEMKKMFDERIVGFATIMERIDAD